MSAEPDEALSLFAPGTSPFHVKGNGFRGQVEYIEANVPGGLAAVLGITGAPEAAAGMYRVSSNAFITEALTAAGAKEIDLRWVGASPEPDRHGVKIVTLTRRVSWRV